MFCSHILFTMASALAVRTALDLDLGGAHQRSLETPKSLSLPLGTKCYAFFFLYYLFLKDANLKKRPSYAL